MEDKERCLLWWSLSRYYPDWYCTMTLDDRIVGWEQSKALRSRQRFQFWIKRSGRTLILIADESTQGGLTSGRWKSSEDDPPTR